MDIKIAGPAELEIVEEHGARARFYTSDLHLGHANIIRFSGRPFGSIEEMNFELVRRWNETVGPEDEVWVLGDVAMGKLVESLELIAELRGHLILVPGNHDRCWSQLPEKRRRRGQTEQYLDAGFESIVDEGPGADLYHQLGRHHVRVSHFPYVGDSQDLDRYTDVRPRDAGLPLLHGHVHEAWKVRGRQINVGVDVWDYAPVSEPRLIELLDEINPLPSSC